MSPAGLPDQLQVRLALADPDKQGTQVARALAGSRPSWRR